MLGYQTGNGYFLGAQCYHDDSAKKSQMPVDNSRSWRAACPVQAEGFLKSAQVLGPQVGPHHVEGLPAQLLVDFLRDADLPARGKRLAASPGIPPKAPMVKRFPNSSSEKKLTKTNMDKTRTLVGAMHEKKSTACLWHTPSMRAAVLTTVP